jgi:hypothetical protein
MLKYIEAGCQLNRWKRFISLRMSEEAGWVDGRPLVPAGGIEPTA